MLALARHDGPYSSTAWSLAKAFAAENRVLYIDNPFTFTDFFKKGKREQIKKRYTSCLSPKKLLLQPIEKLPGLQVLVPPLMLPVNWLPAGRLYRLFSGFNQWLLRRQLDKGLQQEGVGNFVYINSFNPFYGARPASSHKPLQYIYQTVDAIAESNYIGKHGPRLEKEAMEAADVCVATSKTLFEGASRWNQRTVYIPNAADTTLFGQAVEKKLPLPEELKGEQRPFICYTGHIDQRLDYELLTTAARKHSNKLFLMVGPQSGTEYCSSGFADLPNVLFTGKKPLEELPAYLQHAKATLIPFKCNTLCAGIYPLKLNEYLAAGKPVVATPFSEDVKEFEEVVYLAMGPEAFAAALEEAVESDSPEKRKKRLRVAAENSWSARVATFRALFPADEGNIEFENRQKAYEEAIK